MVIADMHTHCEASEDSETPISQLCETAFQKGIAMLAVTDHVELVEYRQGGYDRAAEESWAFMERAVVPRTVRLLRGIELGEPCYDTVLADNVLAAHPYDFVLASQHRLSDELPDYYFIDYSGWTDKAVTREMERYFAELLRVVRWNGFDSLAHLTYPFRYLPEKWRNGDYTPWRGVLDEMLGFLAENGKALEINTSGIRKGQGMTSPDLPLIKRFYELGGKYITIGSDAHRPHEVGADLEVAASLAKEAGFTHYTVYFDRQPSQLSF